MDNTTDPGLPAGMRTGPEHGLVHGGEEDPQEQAAEPHQLLEGSTGSPDDPLSFTEPLPVEEIVDNSLVAEANDSDREEVIARPPKPE